jgi:hypothetical protein
MAETDGVWGPAEKVPGLRAFDPTDSGIAFMSCGPPGRAVGRTSGSHLGCTAIGSYVGYGSSSGLFTMSPG